jgi:hypothetical protein
MKIHPRVLTIAFVLSTIVGILSNSSYYLEMIYTEPQAMGIMLTIIGILSTLVNPLIVFVAFYSVGKGIQTNGEFYSDLLSLFAGNAAGFTFGTLIIWMLVRTVISLDTLSVVLRVVGGFFYSLFSLSFFVGFSALALSYIIKKRQ